MIVKIVSYIEHSGWGYNKQMYEVIVELCNFKL